MSEEQNLSILLSVTNTQESMPKTSLIFRKEIPFSFASSGFILIPSLESALQIPGKKGKENKKDTEG